MCKPTLNVQSEDTTGELSPSIQRLCPQSYLQQQSSCNDDDDHGDFDPDGDEKGGYGGGGKSALGWLCISAQPRMKRHSCTMCIALYCTTQGYIVLCCTMEH